MDYIELNAELRNFCKRLINDGYTKSHLCTLLLGSQKMPMFTQFLDNENRNFGLSVLSKIFEAFDYKLEILPISNENKNETKPILNEINNKFLENYKFILMDNLTNKKVIKREGREGTVDKSISDIVSDIIDNIGE